MALYGVITLYPQIQSIYLSLFRWNGLGTMRFVGLHNFAMLKDDPVVRTAFGNVMHFLILNAGLQILVAFVLAYFLCQKIKGAKVFRFVFFLPVVISSSSVALLWYFMYNSDFGLLNTILRGLGLGVLIRPWLSDPAVARWTVFLPNTWQFVGWFMVIFIAAIDRLPAEILEAAAIDGANNFHVFTRITFPMLKEVYGLCLIMAASGTLQNFDTVYVLTRGGPIHLTELFATYAYWQFFTNYSFGYGSAIVVLILILSIAIAFIVRKFSKNQGLEY